MVIREAHNLEMLVQVRPPQHEYTKKTRRDYSRKNEEFSLTFSET